MQLCRLAAFRLTQLGLMGTFRFFVCLFLLFFVSSFLFFFLFCLVFVFVLLFV